MGKVTRQQFFATIAPIVLFVRRQGSPILPSVRLAQSLLETGGVIHAWNNLGGIKVGSGTLTPYWRGSAVTKGTWEVINGREVKENAAFRAYRTLYHYYKDQDELFKNSRYSKVRAAVTPYEQANQLKLAGYATDPNYASKILSIIKQYSLEGYDNIPAQVEPQNEFKSAQIVPIYYDKVFIGAGYYEYGVNYVPVRAIAEAAGAKVIWNSGQVYVDGTEVEVRMVKSTSYMMARELASLLNLTLEWDANAKVLFID